MLNSLFRAALALTCTFGAVSAHASVITLPAGGSVAVGSDVIQCSGGPIGNDPCSDTNVQGAIGLIKGCIAAGYAATTCIQQTNQQNQALGCIVFTEQCTQLCAAAGYAYPTCQQTCTAH